MANEFIIKNGFRSQGNSEITGALTMSTTNQINFYNSSYFIKAASGLELHTGGGDVINFWSGVSTLGTWSTTGLGIGTTSPSSRLQVQGSGTTSGTTALLVQNANTSASLAVLDNGSVGIGTSSPESGYALDVIGGLKLKANAAAVLAIFRSYSNNLLVGSMQYDSAGGISLTGGSTYYNNSVIIGIGDKISFTTAGTGEKMRIDSIGNVGIGTTSPSASLHISGSSGSALLEIDSPTVNNILFVTGSGNVGIGTGNPLVSLDIRTSNNSAITPLSIVPNDATTLLVGNVGTNGILALGQNNTGQAWLQGRSRLGNGTSQPILLNPLGGNILIGTTTDAGYKLDISGNLRIVTTPSAGNIIRPDGIGVAFQFGNSVNTAYGDFIFKDAGGSDLARILTTGNFGIGTTTPTSRLTVSGSAGTGSAIYAYKSGSTVLDIQGSQGQLFSVVDALSGSLMSVNDVSGLPILEVFSDDRVVMGTYGAPALIVTGSNTVISGSLRGRVVTLSTASATASMDCSLSNFFDLTLSGSMYLGVSNIQPGETINLRITQPATSGSLNYTSSIKFPNGLPYSASATSSVVDLISFISFDSSTLYATSLKNLI